MKNFEQNMTKIELEPLSSQRITQQIDEINLQIAKHEEINRNFKAKYNMRLNEPTTYFEVPVVSLPIIKSAKKTLDLISNLTDLVYAYFKLPLDVRPKYKKNLTEIYGKLKDIQIELKNFCRLASDSDADASVNSDPTRVFHEFIALIEGVIRQKRTLNKSELLAQLELVKNQLNFCKKAYEVFDKLLLESYDREEIIKELSLKRDDLKKQLNNLPKKTLKQVSPQLPEKASPQLSENASLLQKSSHRVEASPPKRPLKPSQATPQTLYNIPLPSESYNKRRSSLKNLCPLL